MQQIQWKAGDIYFDQNGRVVLIEDQAKLAQDVAFYVLDALSVMPKSKTDATSAIMDAMDKLMSDQSSQDLTPGESLKAIKEFFLVPDSEDPTTYYFYLSVYSKDDTIISKLFDVDNRTDLSHLLPDSEEA